jgi:hypothetical protein
VKEILFIFYFLRGMQIPAKSRIMVRNDNISAMFMAENVSSGVRTRQTATRYHFIREHVEDGFIKIVFVKTDYNDSYLFNKNGNKDTYERYVMKFLGKIDG